MGFENLSSEKPTGTEDALERARLLERLHALKDELSKNGGEALMQVAAKFLRNQWTAVQFRHQSEKIPNLGAQASEAIARLIDGEIISVIDHPETGEDLFVIDTEALRSMSRDDMPRIFGEIAYSKESGKTRYKAKPEVFTAVFGKLRAITKEQLERGDIAQKPFLYIPKDAEAALDPEQIKQAQFQGTLWDLASIRDEAKREHPVADGPKANAFETHLAAVIFHPTFGDAYRDENGQLFIRDAQTREYRPFSTAALSGYGLSENKFSASEGKITRSSRQGLEVMAPTLLEKGVLRGEDFRSIRGTTTREYHERPVREIKKSPYVMFDRVNHYLGRQFAGRAEAVKINSQFGGILTTDEHGRKRLTHVFNLFTDTDLPPPNERAQFGQAGALQTQVREFAAEEFAGEKKKEEPEEQYEARMAVLDYQAVFELEQELAEIGIKLSIDPALEAQTAKTLRRISELNLYEKFLAFAKEAREPGLRLLLSVGDDLEYINTLLSINERLHPEKVKEFFRSINPEGIADQPSAMAMAQNRRSLLLRLGSQSEGADQSTEKDFELVKAEVRLFGEVLRIASEAGQITEKDLHGAEILILPATELNDANKKEMIDLFQRTHSHQEKSLLAAGVKEFLEKLESEETRFYVMKHDSKVVAFIRFDDLENGNVNSGSFNVDSLFQGSAIGKALIQAAFEREGANRDIEGWVKADESGLRKFYATLGFKEAGESEIFSGIHYLKLTRPAHRKNGAALAA